MNFTGFTLHNSLEIFSHDTKPSSPRKLSPNVLRGTKVPPPDKNLRNWCDTYNDRQRNLGFPWKLLFFARGSQTKSHAARRPERQSNRTIQINDKNQQKAERRRSMEVAARHQTGPRSPNKSRSRHISLIRHLQFSCF